MSKLQKIVPLNQEFALKLVQVANGYKVFSHEIDSLAIDVGIYNGLVAFNTEIRTHGVYSSRVDANKKFHEVLIGLSGNPAWRLLGTLDSGTSRYSRISFKGEILIELLKQIEGSL